MVEPLPRHVAPGGVRRLIIGFLCGLAAGALVAVVLPRDDGPRRRTFTFDPDAEVDRRLTLADTDRDAAQTGVADAGTDGTSGVGRD